MTERRPLYTPAEARAEAEREGQRDETNAERVVEGCGCCLMEGLVAITGFAAILLVPLALLR